MDEKLLACKLAASCATWYAFARLGCTDYGDDWLMGEVTQARQALLEAGELGDVQGMLADFEAYTACTQLTELERVDASRHFRDALGG